MFRSEPMQKVRIVCLERDRKSVVDALHRAGLLDLRKSKLDLADDSAAEHFTELSDSEIRLAGAIRLLKKPKEKKKQKHIPERHLGVNEIISSITGSRIINRIYSLNDERSAEQQSLKRFQQSEDVARQISGIDVNLDELQSNILSYKAYAAPSIKMLDGLKKEIAAKSLPIEVVESKEKNQLGMLLAYKRGLDIDSLARKYDLRELDLTLEHINGHTHDAFKHITKARADLEARIAAIEKELIGISAAEYSKLSALMEMLVIELTKAEVSEIFKKTDSTIIIEGWVSLKRVKELGAAITKATGGKSYMENLEADELAPTLINRHKLLQPFDYMVNFISVPRSDEIDPAIPFMISFPIFYGIMISDVGYGILSFFFAWYVTKITDPEGLAYNAAKIWQLSAISAVFFGFISNQYFGLQLNQYFTTFVGIDWFKSITTLLAIAIIFGIVQIVAGLAIGFINKYKHHRKLAFGRLASIVLILSGTVAIAGSLFHAFNNTNLVIATGGIAIASLIATLLLSGEEAGEVTNLISHPLSYARLVGFGLSSVVLAFLIDKAFTPSLSGGIAWFVISIVFFIVLHFLNMIVSMFEGAVQGARLNFIEFFTKFYTGGGIKFKPFGSKRVYTKE
jgi:V/A-type H+-transporting ATPase subunit I